MSSASQRHKLWVAGSDADYNTMGRVTGGTTSSEAPRIDGHYYFEGRFAAGHELTITFDSSLGTVTGVQDFPAIPSDAPGKEYWTAEEACTYFIANVTWSPVMPFTDIGAGVMELDGDQMAPSWAYLSGWVYKDGPGGNVLGSWTRGEA
jgi:hypothetical protein